MTKSDVIKKIKAITASAPMEVKQAAAEFINALSDFPNSQMDLGTVNQVWNDDLPDAYQGKYNLK